MTLSKSSDISGLWFSWADKDKMVWSLRLLKLTGVGYERLEREPSTTWGRLKMKRSHQVPRKRMNRKKEEEWLQAFANSD